MNKIFTIILAASITAVSACSASPDKSANREYVAASLEVSRAAQAFDAADYAVAKKLCDSAAAKVAKILSDYPESEIAVRIVSDPQLRLGGVEYQWFCKKLPEKLGLLTDPKFEKLGLLWPVLVNANLRPDDVREAARFAKDQSRRAENDAQKAQYDSLVKSLSEICPAANAGVDTRTNPAAATAPKPATEKEKTVEPKKIADKKFFLNDAKTKAAIVGYDISVVAKLAEMSRAAKADSDETFAEFKKLLDIARANIAKISNAHTRDSANSQLVEIYADAGLGGDAVEIAKSVSDPQLFESAFLKTADAAGKSENYMQAIALASRLPEGARKNEFLAKIAGAVAERGYFGAAGSVLDTVKDAHARELGYARLLLCAKTSMQKKSAAAKISPENFEALAKISETLRGRADFDSENPADRAAVLADFAKVVSDADKQLADKTIALAVSTLPKGGDISECAVPIAEYFAAVGEPEKGLNFVLENLFRLSKFPPESICSLSASVAKTNGKLAAEGFKAAAVHGTMNPVKFAESVVRSGLPNSAQIEVLKTFLPKFGR